MKKIVRQQNYLKELIEAQGNKLISKQALRCIIRADLEPLLDNPEEGVVLHRITNKSGIMGLLKRLEFSEIKTIDYSDEGDNLKEKVWANIEFLCVLTHRFVSIILWSDTDDMNLIKYYSLYNSKLQNEFLDIVDRNSINSIKEFQEHFKPDRRDNILLNSSIKRLIENLDEATKDAVLGFATIQTEKKEDNLTRIVSHEIRNQLSICDLYTEIIKKHCSKNGIEEKTISNALGCITRALKMASNSLLDLKSDNSKELKPIELKELISNVENLTKVYFECKNIKYQVENNLETKILANENNLTAILINLVKNAIEAFGAEGDSVRGGKYINLKTEIEGNVVSIKVSNNAGIIEEPEKIFNTGYTTKTTGQGLGLYICKKSIEKQSGKLILSKNTKECTEFEVQINVA